VIGFVTIGIAVGAAAIGAQRLFRRAAAERAGSGVVQIIIWARSGKVPGLARQKKWVKAKVSADEAGRLVWVRPAGESLALTLHSRESRLRNKTDLFFLDPGTPVWDAVTAEGQELGFVIHRRASTRSSSSFRSRSPRRPSHHASRAHRRQEPAARPMPHHRLPPSPTRFSPVPPATARAAHRARHRA
jgi:hypothetical protein